MLCCALGALWGLGLWGLEGAMPAAYAEAVQDGSAQGSGDGRTLEPEAGSREPKPQASGRGGSDSASPPQVDAGAEAELEPQITIIHRGGQTIEEYRINGQLYMIKITPHKGVPYFLVDVDGDGDFDLRSNELDEDLLVPRWTILRW